MILLFSFKLSCVHEWLKEKKKHWDSLNINYFFMIYMKYKENIDFYEEESQQG